MINALCNEQEVWILNPLNITLFGDYPENLLCTWFVWSDFDSELLQIYAGPNSLE